MAMQPIISQVSDLVIMVMGHMISGIKASKSSSNLLQPAGYTSLIPRPVQAFPFLLVRGGTTGKVASDEETLDSDRCISILKGWCIIRTLSMHSLERRFSL